MAVSRKWSQCFVHSLIVILLLIPNSDHAPESRQQVELPSTASSLFQQLFRSWTRVLGQVIGFSNLIFKALNPPSAPDLIKQHGYPSETHYVQTEDGIILEIHRIPHGPTAEFFRLTPRIPVLLMHGIAQSSSDFLINSPTKNSLGFFLSDEGYDVWLGNLRGVPNKNTGHGNFTWNYSFHEMGVYDIPAIVQYVCQRTNFKSIHYIGFSMGNTAFVTALSKVPSLNSKIKLGVILGPSVFHDNYYNGWLKLIAPLAIPGEAVQNVVGSFPLIHPLAANILHRILPVICHPTIDVIGICLTVTQTIFGNDKGQLTKQKVATITKVSPTPLSSKLLIHYMQHLASGRFREYDYGPDQNLILYGDRQPPDYDLSNAVAPVSILVGPEDLLAHRKDAQTLANRLPNVVDFFFIPYQHFHHLDFCYAEDAGVLVYQHVLKMLKRFD